VSLAADGGLDDVPMPRGSSGGEGARRSERGGAESDGSGPGGVRPRWRRRLDPRNGNVMMVTDLLKKAADVVNDGLIAAHAVLTVSDQVEASANRQG